jgi:uncharacterized membrane protein YeiH
MDTFAFILEIIGTVAFAVSGAMTAIKKHMDALGVIILGLVTAVGGGIIRDLVLGNTPPNTFRDSTYAIVAVFTSIVIFFPFVRRLLSHTHKVYDAVLFFMDSLGLSIFTVMGIFAANEQAWDHGMFLLLFVGVITGVGGGVIIDGKMLVGANGAGGEIGHICVRYDETDSCGCGRKGCLECYASSKGLKYTAIELLQASDAPSKLRNIPTGELSSKDIAKAAKSGDSIARKVFDITGEILGEALANLVTVSAPQAIFLCGGVANAKNLILTPVKRAMEKNILPLWKGKVKLELSSLEYENAPILGAAALAIKEIEKDNNITARRKIF